MVKASTVVASIVIAGICIVAFTTFFSIFLNRGCGPGHEIEMETFTMTEWGIFKQEYNSGNITYTNGPKAEYNAMLPMKLSKNPTAIHRVGIFQVSGISISKPLIRSFNAYNVTNEAPKIDLQIDGCDPPNQNDNLFTEPTWNLSTNSDDQLFVVFNLTRSVDLDSPKFATGYSYKDLIFKISIRKEAEDDRTVFEGKGSPDFPYTFDVKDVSSYNVCNFTITITVTDQGGLSTTRAYKLRLLNDPMIEYIDENDHDPFSFYYLLFYVIVGLIGLNILIIYKIWNLRKKGPHKE